jgi:hypothetical protein
MHQRLSQQRLVSSHRTPAQYALTASQAAAVRPTFREICEVFVILCTSYQNVEDLRAGKPELNVGIASAT